MNSESRKAFFRQSGWMVLATGIGGVFMSAVHPVTAKIEDYALFAVLLRCLIPLGIPTAGLQIVFAQQAAAAIEESQVEQLRRTARSVMAVLFFGWLALAAFLFFAQDSVLRFLQINNARALWTTMLVVLVSLWLPVLRGILQGRQNFMALGWAGILDGAGRLLAASIIVKILHGGAAGAMASAVFGQLTVLAACLWWGRDVFTGRTSAFQWRVWFKRLIPLTFGFGALLFVQSADLIYVQSVLSGEQVRFYTPVNVIGFALVQFTGPMVAVMFPKVVRSLARTEKTDALKLTFFTTAAVGIAAALVCTILPELPFRVLYFTRPEFWKSAPLVPWFVWCMVVTTLANVLIGNLLAREKFSIVPSLVVIGLAYGLTLFLLRNYLKSLPPFDALQRVVLTLGGFNLALLAVAAWFTWHKAALTPVFGSKEAAAR
ncbi:MAG: hypothetical protein ABIQ35_04935 [Verrucomicrobiota bacterium]